MALRVEAGGQSLWPACHQHGVTAITYEPLRAIDLTRFSDDERPSEWGQLSGSQPASMNAFAWRIRGGDHVYVRESGSGGRMVGFGVVKAPLDSRAYRFDRHSPIHEANGGTWHHLIDMDWDDTFKAFQYKDRSPNTTVLRATGVEAEQWSDQSITSSHEQENLSPIDIQRALLLETSYPRYTAASLRLILRLHSKLSNDFRSWMQRTRHIAVAQEVDRIDYSYIEHGKKTMVEFKIAYGTNTQKAIREAIGQILEYNFYPPRQRHDRWLLVLSVQPTHDDFLYVDRLRTELGLPLDLGWPASDGFALRET